MRTASFVFLFFLIPLVAPAQPQGEAPAKRTSICLRPDMVWGWTVVDDKTLIVTDKVQKAFKVSLRTGCFDLKWHQALSFKSYSGLGVSCLSRNDYVLVPAQAGRPAQRCLISEVAAYAPASR